MSKVTAGTTTRSPKSKVPYLLIESLILVETAELAFPVFKRWV